MDNQHIAIQDLPWTKYIPWFRFDEQGQQQDHQYLALHDSKTASIRLARIRCCSECNIWFYALAAPKISVLRDLSQLRKKPGNMTLVCCIPISTQRRAANGVSCLVRKQRREKLTVDCEMVDRTKETNLESECIPYR